MARPKKVTAESVDISEMPIVHGTVMPVMYVRVLPLTHEFGNGDMNILRDKLNEVIKSL